MQDTLSYCLGFALLSSACTTDPVEPPPVEQPSEALQADLQATLDRVVSEGHTPGAVLTLTEGGGTWSGAAGIADLDDGAAMTPEVRFRAGSMMKPLIAVAVLQLVEEGRLELDDSLTERLPAEVTASISGAASIDVAMLLGHRSGIAEWVTDAVRGRVVSEPTHVWTLEEVVGIVEAEPPAFEPGAQYGYSNTNYVLLGEIIEQLEGRSWRDVVRERVIEPAGMEDTALPEPGDIECVDCAHGYVPFDGSLLDTTLVDPSMAGASGGHALITTTADLARFLEHLETGTFFEDRETRDAMFAFQPAPDPETHSTGYGLGVMELDGGGHVVVGHLGITAGYSGFMLYVPETHRYVTGFMNVMGDPGVLILPVVERLAQRRPAKCAEAQPQTDPDHDSDPTCLSAP